MTAAGDDDSASGPIANITAIANVSVIVVDNVSYVDFTQIEPVHMTFVLLYLFVMFLALAGNTMVVFTVCCNKKMHTVVNYYIVNLAISDLMVAGFVLPLKLLELGASPGWSVLNNGLCTFLLYSQPIFVFASVLTLMATCIER
ncbi:PREDICTED: neuropeptide FF receptor 2-like [Priapulus caudatus]|uniref:Neuropeptide FF receptor 2-like n=1 Tax=Priapulus caudatus TaxID=37621 RepID=A0ABM1DXG9_PRICU|nr:PREDICTED: neuropeptide FF receptor 2-like [Priapulus caudatus]